jgi:hypothetical protein
VILLWITRNITIGELFDPVCGLEVAILNGDDEVRSLAVVVLNVSFRNLLGELVVRNLLMVPSGTRRLKATAQEVSVNKD